MGCLVMFISAACLIFVLKLKTTLLLDTDVTKQTRKEISGEQLPTSQLSKDAQLVRWLRIVPREVQYRSELSEPKTRVLNEPLTR